MALRAIDVSDWGFFRFAGPDAAQFLQGLVTADTSKLSREAALPFCVLTPKGRLVADGELYAEGPGLILACVRPAAADGFAAAFERMIMLSQSKLERRRSATWLVLGEGFSRGLAWDRLGEPGRLLMGAGDPPVDATLLTPGEFQAIRIAAGFPWYGVDMDAETLPLEARQDAAISTSKGCYMGQETVSRLMHMGHVNRVLVGLDTDAPAGTPVGGGKITSAAGGKALATVRAADSKPGTVLDAGGKRAVVRDLPWPKPLTRIGAR